MSNSLIVGENWRWKKRNPWIRTWNPGNRMGQRNLFLICLDGGWTILGCIPESMGHGLYSLSLCFWLTRATSLLLSVPTQCCFGGRPNLHWQQSSDEWTRFLLWILSSFGGKKIWSTYSVLSLWILRNLRVGEQGRWEIFFKVHLNDGSFLSTPYLDCECCPNKPD